MRNISQIKKVKYTSDWIPYDANLTYRLFNYLGLDWNLILRYKGIGGWTIRLCCEDSNELYVFNSGVNRMSISINDDLIYGIDGWYYEDLKPLKLKLNDGLKVLLGKYEEFIKI